MRLQVTSSHFPQFDRNPKTGKPFGTRTEVVKAEQTVHHGGANLSRVILPVIYE